MAGLEAQSINALSLSLSGTPGSTIPMPAGFEAAFAAILITILAGGIAFGIGLALRSRRLSGFGKEELLASVINAALFGAFFGMIALINGVYLDYSSSYAASGSSVFSNCTVASALVSNMSSTPLAPVFASCEYSLGAMSLQQAAQSLLSSQMALGYLAGISVNLPGASISPFAGFDSAASTLSKSLDAIYAFFAAASLYSSALGAFSSLAMSIGFPAGFLLRAFYPTRRLGSLLLALSFASISIMPLCALASAQSVDTAIYKSGQLVEASKSFNDYAAPALAADPNDTGFFSTVRSTFSSGQLTSAANALASAAWSLASYCALAFAILPLISAILSLAFALALAGALDLEGLSSVYKYS